MTRFRDDKRKILEFIIGPGLATLFLVYPGLFALMWDFSFWGLLLTRPGKFSFTTVPSTISMFVMGFTFPVGLIATVILWRLMFLDPEKFQTIGRTKKVLMALVLCLGSAISLWVLIGMPGFNQNNSSLHGSIFLLLVGPMFVGLKYARRLLSPGVPD